MDGDFPLEDGVGEWSCPAEGDLGEDALGEGRALSLTKVFAVAVLDERL